MHDLDWLREILRLGGTIQQMDWETLLIAATVGMGVLLSAAVLYALYISSLGREKKMCELPARALERVVLSDAITAGIEEEVFTGRMSRKRARFWYQWFSQELGLTDLIVNKGNQKLHRERARRLKGAISMRLLSEYGKGSSLPGEAIVPAVVTKVKSVKSKSTPSAK